MLQRPVRPRVVLKTVYFAGLYQFLPQLGFSWLLQRLCQLVHIDAAQDFCNEHLSEARVLLPSVQFSCDFKQLADVALDFFKQKANHFFEVFCSLIGVDLRLVRVHGFFKWSLWEQNWVDWIQTLFFLSHWFRVLCDSWDHETWNESSWRDLLSWCNAIHHVEEVTKFV